MLLILLSVVVIFLLYKLLVFRPKNFPPGPLCLPVVGSIPFIPDKNVHYTMRGEWMQKYGPVVGLMLGYQPAIAVSGAEEVLEVLRREEFQGRPDTFNSRDRSFNQRLGFFFTDGTFWIETRRFTLRHLRDLGFGKKSLEGLILEEAEELFDRMKKSEIQENGSFQLSVINILWAIMGGVRHSHDDKNFKDLLHKITEMFRTGNPSGDLLDVIPPLRFVNPSIGGYKQRKVGNKNVQNFMRDSIKEHIKTLDENEPRDFIDVYLKEMKSSKVLTEDALIMICLDLFSAGAESVNNTIDYFFLYMILNPEIQKKVHGELDRVVGHSRRPSLDDKHNLHYLEAAITETYRINPIAPQTPHHRCTRDTTLNGFNIPKDTTVLVNISGVLSDRTHWGDPEVFRPERFLDSEGKFFKDEWMINFGLGKRVCLGEALARNVLFLYITSYMQEFSISIVDGDPRPSTYPMPGFTTAPQHYRMKRVQRI